MATKTKAPEVVTVEAATKDFQTSFATFGAEGVYQAGRGELLRNHTATLCALPGGVEAAADVLKGMAAAHLKKFARPEKAKGLKKRTEDPACVAWDRQWKLHFQNPGVQMNLAIKEAGILKAIRIAQDGTIDIDDIEDAPSVPTAKTLKAMLKRTPYGKAIEDAFMDELGKWKKAGIEALEEAARVAPAPTVTVAPATDADKDALIALLLAKLGK